jgi:hypothetical protein
MAAALERPPIVAAVVLYRNARRGSMVYSSEV